MGRLVIYQLDHSNAESPSPRQRLFWRLTLEDEHANALIGLLDEQCAQLGPLIGGHHGALPVPQKHELVPDTPPCRQPLTRVTPQQPSCCWGCPPQPLQRCQACRPLESQMGGHPACDVDEVLGGADGGEKVLPAGALVPLESPRQRDRRQRLWQRVRVRVQRDAVAAPRLEVGVLVFPAELLRGPAARFLSTPPPISWWRLGE
jgi:hypothetical protein